MKIALSIVLQMVCCCLLAQKMAISNREFSLRLGGRETHMEKFPDNENLDFLNYFYTDPEYLDYALINMGFRFDFLSKMSADLKLIVMSDLIPDNYDISAYYHFNPTFSMGIGSMLCRAYVSYFEQFHVLSMPDYYLVDDNIQQFKAYDLGFFLTPGVNLSPNGWFRATARFDLGISTFLTEESTFHHKKKYGNERIIYHYSTRTSYQPYVRPSVELRLQALTTRRAAAGLVLSSNFYYANRSMDYMRSVQSWTSYEAVNKVIRTPKHTYTRFEADIGLYVKW